MDEDGWWDNLLNTWRRWNSDEVPHAEVRIRLGDLEKVVMADEEGYYQASFDRVLPDQSILQWIKAEASTLGSRQEITAVHEAMIVPEGAEFGIISDLDDTVLHTGITSLLLAAKLTFLENAKTRKPLEGVAQLYATLQRGSGGDPVNPVFYISSSPWNLYDLLEDFLRLNEIPAGPIMLRDLGLDQYKFVKEKGHGHKREKALALMDAYPGLPFVLVGDSGQEDPAIYAEVAEAHPGRVLAIYIRDVDPGRASALDATVAQAMDKAGKLGIPMILAENSLAISRHAVSIGLMPEDTLQDVASEVQADRQLPGTGEEAVKDALQSILPG